MHVLIYEPFRGGHHSNYVMTLLPALIAEQAAGRISQITLATSALHLGASGLADRVAGLGGIVGFVETAPDVRPDLPFRERLRLARDFTDVVARSKPDAAVLTTGDSETLVAALPGRSALRRIGRSIPTVAILHNGYAGLATRPADRAKDALYRWSTARAPWSAVLHVNPLVVRSLPELAARKRLALLPDPVPSAAPVDKAVARVRLGLPPEGHYVGHVGATDIRKALPELLAAFRTIAGPDERLLLAGRLSPDHRALVDGAYADLLADARILLIDRALSNGDVHLALQALDLVAPLNYPRPALSANFLRAVLARRPILADRFGYTGHMLARFRLGTTTDVRDAARLSEDLRTALDAAPGWLAGPDTDRLVRFHHPDQFTGDVLAHLGVRPRRADIEDDMALFA